MARERGISREPSGRINGGFICLSRASASIIRQNLVIALGVIGLLLIASGFGVIPLSVAVVVHEGSTIVVVLNALRLLAWHERSQ